MSNQTLKIIIGVLVVILIGVWINNWVNVDKNAFEDINPQYASVYEYEQFIDKYPQSEYVEDAYEGLFSIANEAGTIAALVNYISEYPKSHLLEKARKTVDERCSMLYSEAINTNSIAAWEKYVLLTPNSHHKDAEIQIAKLEKALWGTDYRAWKQANKENSISSFSKYLKLYPKGKYSYSANQKLIDLQVANVFSKDHGSLPSMNKTSSGYGSKTNLEVYNNTSHTLTLLYSGTTSKRLVLSPRTIGRLSLGNGRYRIAASVNASNVRDFAGTEELNGGAYEVEYYIQTQSY